MENNPVQHPGTPVRFEGTLEASEMGLTSTPESCRLVDVDMEANKANKFLVCSTTTARRMAQ